MNRCPECGRGGRGSCRLTAPALLTLAAGEVAEGVDMEGESLHQLVLLRRTPSAAARAVDARIDAQAAVLANGRG